MLLLSPSRRPGAPVGTRVPARGHERQHLVTAVVVTLRPRPPAAAPVAAAAVATTASTGSGVSGAGAGTTRPFRGLKEACAVTGRPVRRRPGGGCRGRPR